MFRNKRLNLQQRKAKLLKLLILQTFLFYYVAAATMYYFSSTNAYFGDITYASIEIRNKDQFPNKPPLGQKDSSSLEEVKAWIQCPNVFASFYNNGGDMLVDTTYSVYRQINGNNWELLGTYPLKALKSKETRTLSYEPKESGTYRFVVEQVPTHKGNSHPKIETPKFDYKSCNSGSSDQSKESKIQPKEDAATQQDVSSPTENQPNESTSQNEEATAEQEESPSTQRKANDLNKTSEPNTEEINSTEATGGNEIEDSKSSE